MRINKKSLLHVLENDKQVRDNCRTQFIAVDPENAETRRVFMEYYLDFNKPKYLLTRPAQATVDKIKWKDSYLQLIAQAGLQDGMFYHKDNVDGVVRERIDSFYIVKDMLCVCRFTMTPHPTLPVNEVFYDSGSISLIDGSMSDQNQEVIVDVARTILYIFCSEKKDIFIKLKAHGKVKTKSNGDDKNIKSDINYDITVVCSNWNHIIHIGGFPCLGSFWLACLWDRA